MHTNNPEGAYLALVPINRLVLFARGFVDDLETGYAYNNLSVEESAELARERLGYVVTELHGRALQIEQREQDLRRHFAKELTGQLQRDLHEAEASRHDGYPWFHYRRTTLIREELHRRGNQLPPVVEIITGEWDEDVPGEDGAPRWLFSTDHGDGAELFAAEITSSTMFTWTVGERGPEAFVRDSGQTHTWRAAQLEAEYMFSVLVAQLAAEERDFPDEDGR